MASIIINPVDGNNIINAANAAAGVTFTGTPAWTDSNCYSLSWGPATVQAIFKT